MKTRLLAAVSSCPIVVAWSITVAGLSGCGGPAADNAGTDKKPGGDKQAVAEAAIEKPQFGLTGGKGKETKTPQVAQQGTFPTFGPAGGKGQPGTKTAGTFQKPQFGPQPGRTPTKTKPLATPKFGPGVGVATAGVPGRGGTGGGEPPDKLLRRAFGTAPPPQTTLPAATAKGSASSEPQPATSGDINDLMAHVRADEYPAVGLARLTRFRQQHTLSEDQLAKIGPESAELTEKAQQDMVRHGKRWVSREEATANAKEAAALVEKAIGQLAAVMKRRPGTAFKLQEALKPPLRLLLQASRTDPNSLQADFAIATANTVLLLNDPLEAERRFHKVLSREPDHVPTLNNLALSEALRGQPGQALRHFKQALALAPDNADVRHNFFRLVSEGRRLSIYISDGLLKQCLTFGRELQGDEEKCDQAVARAAKRGWVYLPLHVAKGAKPRPFLVDKSCSRCLRRGKVGNKQCKFCKGSGVDPRL